MAQAASDVGGNPELEDLSGPTRRGPIIRTAASAHIPKPNANTVHHRVERPRREAIIAVSGASARSIAMEVAISSAGGSWNLIRANPEV